MKADSTDPRRILIDVIHRAEMEPAFRRQLAADPHATLRRHGITFDDVKAFSSEFDNIRDVMEGCNDGTCFTSGCPDSCYVTACGTTDCGETFPNGAWKQWGVDRVR